MNKNKFIILMPSYNVAKWIGLSIETIKLQSYKNFECVIVDDASTDDTYSIVESSIQDDSRFHLIRNKNNLGSSLGNMIQAFDYIQPDDEDIIIRLDGDDWLSSVFVLEYLDNIYNSTGCWLTYGTYQTYPSGQDGSHHCIDIPDDVHEDRAYREWTHVYSHLRTHKAFLLKNVDRNDLKYTDGGDYFREAEDVAHMFPLIEMCGKDKIFCIKDILLILNRENENNVANKRLNKQKETEALIRNKKVYEVLSR
jgi:glycosyltransferase involved in cell wall biosynthesis